MEFDPYTETVQVKEVEQAPFLTDSKSAWPSTPGGLINDNAQIRRGPADQGAAQKRAAGASVQIRMGAGDRNSSDDA